MFKLFKKIFTIDELNQNQLNALKRKYAWEVIHNPPLHPENFISNDTIKRVYRNSKFTTEELNKW